MDRYPSACDGPGPGHWSDEFLADLRVIDDPQFEGLEAAALAAAGADWSLGHVSFLVDDRALIRPYPIVAVELTTGLPCGS